MRKDGEPTGADRVVGPAEHPQYTRIIKSPNVIGDEPTRFREWIRFWRISIALGEGGTTEGDPTIVIDTYQHSVQRNAVVHAPTCSFAHAVRPVYRKLCGGGLFRNARGHRAASD